MENEFKNNLGKAIQSAHGLEINAVRGMVSFLKLDSSVFDRLIGTLDENGKPNKDGELYTQEKISDDIISLINEKYKASESHPSAFNDKHYFILELLGSMHNAWVTEHQKDFSKDKGIDRFFVNLELLNWDDVKNYLMVLGPILDAAGIREDEDELRAQFEILKRELMKDEKLFTEDDLVNYLMKGSKGYYQLEGLKTENGMDIEKVLTIPLVAKTIVDTMNKNGIRTEPKEKIDYELEYIRECWRNQRLYGTSPKYAGYYEHFDGRSPEEFDPEVGQEIEVYRRRILKDAFNLIDKPREIKRKITPSETKTEITPGDIAKTSTNVPITTKEVKGIKGLLQRFKNLFIR